MRKNRIESKAKLEKLVAIGRQQSWQIVVNSYVKTFVPTVVLSVHNGIGLAVAGVAAPALTRKYHRSRSLGFIRGVPLQMPWAEKKGLGASQTPIPGAFGDNLL